MRKISLALALAAGLFASFAITGTSHAGSVLTLEPSTPGAISDYSVNSGTVTSVTFVFDTAPASISAVTGSPTGTFAITGNDVVFTPGTAVAAGLLTFNVSFSGPVTAGDFSYGYTTGTLGGSSVFGFQAVPYAVPEPASMALLGIGMASFFTYRRLFKKATI
jgi:hypothetical protein